MGSGSTDRRGGTLPLSLSWVMEAPVGGGAIPLSLSNRRGRDVRLASIDNEMVQFLSTMLSWFELIGVLV